MATLVPSMSWGGTGLIGVSIRYCALAGANEFVWHVLDVFDNSPAYRAGLISFEDYIVGTPDLLFNDAEDFSTLVQSNLDREIQLYVYNAATDTIRIVRPPRLASRRQHSRLLTDRASRSASRRPRPGEERAASAATSATATFIASRPARSMAHCNSSSTITFNKQLHRSLLLPLPLP